MTCTNKDLKYWYSVANSRYFGNKLPKDLVVKFGDLGKHILGSTYVTLYKGGKKVAGYPAERLVISKDIRTRQTIVILTLLHEMVHVENPKWNCHGDHFNRRMKELANEGAFNGLW